MLLFKEAAQGRADARDIDEKRVVAVLSIQLVVRHGRVASLTQKPDYFALLVDGK